MKRELSAPPSVAVEWIAVCVLVIEDGRGGKREAMTRAHVEARTWFDARTEAMAVLGCGPDELVVRLREETRT